FLIDHEGRVPPIAPGGAGMRGGRVEGARASRREKWRAAKTDDGGKGGGIVWSGRRRGGPLSCLLDNEDLANAEAIC
ncbi:MAG TPA: hypothetical protein PLY09_07415, partial [Methanothrix sp.]|nr:hypothetical protein [Methanothrix sp.]